MDQSLDALRTLTRGPGRSNAQDPQGLVQSRLRREDLLQEMKRNIALAASNPLRSVAGATAPDVTDLESQLQEDPNFGDAAQQHVADTEKVNQDITTYQRPDVTAVRTSQQDDALEKLLMPIAARGEYDVEAAKQGQISREQMQERSLENSYRIAAQREQGLNARADDTIQLRDREARRRSLQAELLSLMSGKDAPSAGMFSIQSRTNAARKQAIQEELATLGASPESSPEEFSPVPSTAGRPTAADLIRKYGR